MTSTSHIEIYQAEDGQTRIAVRLENDTLWLSQAQLGELFGKDVNTISEHIGNVFKEGELDRGATTRKFRVVRSEGNRQVAREIEHYNLYAAISVGYRVNSKKGTQFRIWATRRLRDLLVHGYSISRERFEQNAAELEQALALIRKAAQNPELGSVEGRGLVEIIGRYTQTFLWLQRYDEGLLEDPKGQPGGVLVDPQVAMQALGELKRQLMERGEATELFASPRDAGLAGIFGNLDQSVFGDPAYPTVEGKAAHLSCSAQQCPTGL